MDYKNQIQAQLEQNNAKQAWHSVTSIPRCSNSTKRCSVTNSKDVANDLNACSCRFGRHDFETERKYIFQDATLFPVHTMEISKHDVANAFKKLKINKAAGPDRITGKLHKECREKLSSVFQMLF